MAPSGPKFKFRMKFIVVLMVGAAILSQHGGVAAQPAASRPGAAAAAIPAPAAAVAVQERGPQQQSAVDQLAPGGSSPHGRCALGAEVAANGTCACAAGWTGRDCMACSGSSVCPAFTGQPDSTCNTQMLYSNATAYKAYSCDLIGGLAKWVTGVAAICNVRGERLPYADGLLGLQPGGLINTAAGATPESNRFCKLEVGLLSQPEDPLVCLATKCVFTEGNANFKCSAVQCSCGAEGKCPPLIQSVVNNLANASIGLTCPNGDGRCILDGVQPRFSLICRSGECTQPRSTPKHLNGNATTNAVPPKPFPVIAVVSAVPIVLLLILGLLLFAYVLASRRMFAAGAKAPPPPPALNAKGVALLAPQPSICLATGDANPATAFVFDSIVCSVPAPSGRSAAAPRARPGEYAASLASGLRARRAGGVAATATVTGAVVIETGSDSYDDVAAAVTSPAAAAAAAAGRKVLLHGVSGVVDEGEVLGVMGPSGSGKSTLLSILSGAVESVGAGARVEGAVTLGGEKRRGVLRKVTAFVPQKDVLLPALTVEECVRYSALLRLPRNLDASEIQERIDGVLSELGLSHVASSLVGGSTSIRGVSGGERRRVTIAMALVTRPKLVIMDEPTSGLDSYTAYNLMRTAQEIAMHNRVVIMSLHQPSPDMFDSLSQVLLLVQGRLAYLGPPSGVAPHFAAAGLPIPRKRQPAEHMLHVASQPAGLAALLQYAAKCANTRRRVAALPTAPSFAASHGPSSLSAFGGGSNSSLQSYGSSSLGSLSNLPSYLVSMIADIAPAIESQNPLAIPGSASAVASSAPEADAAAAAAAAGASACPLRNWLDAKARETAVLYWRAFTNMRREPRLLLLHMLVALVLGLVVGAVFFQLESSQVGVQNRLGSMFFALALFGWTSVSVVDGLVLERELVEREVVGHYYRGSTYLLASLVLDGLLLRTLPALLFSALMYPMVGLLHEWTRVVTFMFVLATYTCTVGALTTALTALCRTSSATTLAMNIILLMWVLVGGYLVNPMSIPVWVRWIRNLSPMSFAFEVLAANEMADQYYALKVAGFAQLDGIKGDVFLRTLGLVPSRALESAIALASFYLGSVLLAFVATTYTLWRHSGGSFGRLFGRLRRLGHSDDQ